MNALTTFLQADWAERAGWTLLHSLWQIAAVAAVYAIAAFVLRNRSANSRYVLGCVAILAMLGLPMGTYALLSQDGPLEITDMSNTPAVVASPAESPAPPSDLTQATTVSADPLPPGTATDPALSETISAETATTKTVTVPAEVVPEQPAATDLLSRVRRYLPWTTAVWLAGVVLLSLRPLWGWFHVRRLTRHGLSPLSDTLRQAGQRVKQRLRVNRAVQFAQSALVEVPTVVGCLRPMILLPASAISGLSTAQIELILAHELAHVRRHDWVVNLAQTVIEALLFYHPGMWWVSNQIRKERENCCDDMAVAIGGDRTIYAQALARLEEQRSTVPAAVLAATGGSLLGRVRRLMGKPNRECGSAVAGVWFAALAFLLVVVVLATGYVRALGEADGSSEEEPIAATDDEAKDFVSAYKGPCDVAASPDGKRLYVVQHDARALAVVSLAKDKVVRTIALPAEPTGVCVSPDGKSVYVTCGVANGQLCVVDSASGKVTAKLAVGHSPRGPSLSPDGKTAYVCNRFDNSVSVVDLVAKKEVASVNVLREPFDSAITPDGKTLFVTNHLPIDQATSYDVACEVTCIDTSTHQTKQIRMRNGDTNLSGVCVSPDGKYAYVVSVLTRYQMPRTQLERGWAATNALSIIDARNREYINTVLLDDVDLGAADPYDVATSPDGSTLYVSHAGTHEMSVVNATAMLEKLLALPLTREALTPAETRKYQSSAEDVPNDLAFLVGMRKRIPLEGLGPRGLVIVGSKAYCAMYFSDTLSCVDMRADPEPTVSQVALGPKPVMTEQRQGELYFQDARLCFQQWLTCATCHPNGRTDGLNWDLMNDGLGNPKNVKSMLLAHQTPPMMISGVRADAQTAVRAAFRHIQFEVVPEDKSKAVDAYLKSLEPTPSPYLVNGELSESAQRGKALFESDQLGCATCHPAPLYTDLKMHKLGRGQYDRRDTWDTPTLIECWRTAPYLHDGRHATMKEVFSQGNHGEASDKLTDAQIDDLTEFVLSLSDAPTDEKLREKSGDFQGTVFDVKTGKPIAGATVEWADLSFRAALHEQVLTDSRGRYALSAAKSGPEYRLAVHASGYAPQWLYPKTVPGTKPQVHDFKLAAGQRAHGVVTDKQKRTLAHVTVTARTAVTGFDSSFSSPTSAEAIPGPPRRTTTDAAGRFEIVDLPEGQVQLNFSAKHRHINDKNYAVGEPLDVVMSGSGKSGVLQVRAIDTTSGKPISAFHLTQRYDPAWFAVDKADGRFRFPGQHTLDGVRLVYVYAERYAPVGERVPAVAEDSDEYFTVRLTPSPAFVGQLVDAESGKPIGKAKVMCGFLGEIPYFDWNEYDKYIDGYHGLKWVQRAVTGDDGVFTFAEGGEVPKGDLFILAEGYQRTLLHAADRAAADATDKVVVRLQPQATLSGVLTQAGRPVPNVEVGIWKHQVGAKPEQEFEQITTDSQGRFRFENLQPATYSVSMDSPSLRISRQVVVDQGSDATVALGADLGPHSLHGKSIPYARITLRPQFDWDYRVFAKTADASGNYRFEGLQAGMYSVDLRHSYPGTGTFLNRSLPTIAIRGDEQRELTPMPLKKPMTTEREGRSARPQQQAVNRMLRPLLSLRSTHPEMARFREDVKHDVQVVDGRVQVTLSYEHNYVAGIKTKPAGPKTAGKPWCRLAVLIRPDTGEATQLRFTDAGRAVRWNGQVNTRGYRVASPPMLIVVAVETGASELQVAVNRIIDAELNKMLKEIYADNPLGLDDDTLIKFFHTGKALGVVAWKCAEYYRREGRMPEEVPKKDPFAPDEQMRLVLSEKTPGLVQIWSVGPDGDWDGGRQIDSTKTPLDGDLGVEMNRDTRTPRKYLADDAMVRLLEGKRLSHYLAAKGPRLPKPELKDDGLKWGPVVDGLQLAVELAPKKEAYYLGEKIDVRFHVRNAADYAIVVGLPVGLHREMGPVFIHDESGKRLRGASMNLLGLGGGRRHQTLKPGEAGSFDNADFALVAPGRPAFGWPLAHQAEATPGVYTVRFRHHFAADGSEPRGWVGELETAPVTIRIAEYPKFALHRVAAYVDRSDSFTSMSGLRDTGNGPERDAMRLKKHRLDDLVLDGVPLVTEKDIASYDWDRHILRLTPKAYDRLTESIKPQTWGIPFVVQAAGQPIYQGTFWATGAKYSRAMPTISLDLPDETLPKNAIRIEASTAEEGETPDDPREDERIHGALQKAGRLVDPAVETETLPTLKVRAVDKQGKPIADASVLVYDGNNFWAGMPVDFKQISKPTDKDGWANLGTLPQDSLRVQVNGRKDAFSTSHCYIYEGEEGFVLTSLHPQIEIESDGQTVTLVFTMRRHVDLDFEVVDSETGKAIWWPKIYYKDEQRKRWWTLSLIDAGGQHDFATIVEEMSDSQFRVAARGYYPAEFRLDEKLELGKKAKHRIEMDPAPEIRFTVLTPDGKPAEGASFKYVNPEDLSHSLRKATSSDSSGALAVGYPAQGDLARIELTHLSGRAVIAVEDLPERTTVTENGEIKDVILCELRLSPPEAETPADPHGIEPAWGKAADGVHVRLTKAMGHWERSDRPLAGLLLRYDVKNEGNYILHLPENGLRHLVEVDGQWYEWVDPRITKESDKSFSTPVSRLLDFKPGSSRKDMRVDVTGGWLAIPKEMDIAKAIQARRAVGFGSADFEDHGPELALTPGKHRVRVAVICPSARAPFHGVIRAVSEAVEVEIPPADSGEDERSALPLEETSEPAVPPSVEPSGDKPVQDIQVELSAGIFRDGQQWLSVTVRNDSSDMTARLEPGGFPAELLIDGVAYRSTRIYVPPPRRSGVPRIIKPGKTNYGAEFTLHKDWVTVDEPKGLPLKPGKHSVRAIVYATGEDSEAGGDRVRLLSNPVEIGADGRAVGSREVRIRVLGGAEKEPLKGLELTVWPSGRKEGITAITREDGTATFTLFPGGHRIRFDSRVILPYLPIPVSGKSQTRREDGWTRHEQYVTVAETAGDQQFEFNLADPCELVLRAVDVDTGRGIPGVGFGYENFGNEDWLQPIHDEALGPRKIVSVKQKSYQTDQQGYFRRYMGPRGSGWKYRVWVTPPGYEPVKPGEEVEIPTPLGQKKAEDTFLFRRTKVQDNADVSITGHVLGIDGKPAAGYRVTASGEGLR